MVRLGWWWFGWSVEETPISAKNFLAAKPVLDQERRNPAQPGLALLIEGRGGQRQHPLTRISDA